MVDCSHALMVVMMGFANTPESGLFEAYGTSTNRRPNLGFAQM
jgi:hypothetical protein